MTPVVFEVGSCPVNKYASSASPANAQGRLKQLTERSMLLAVL